MPAVGRQVSKLRKKVTSSREPKYRVFLVDDYEMATSAIKTCVNEAPEKDMLFVGHSLSFDERIPKLIKESGANVAFIDVLDSNHDAAGLRTIREVRRELGPNFGIVGYSSEAGEYWDVSIERGADKFLSKGATNESHRATIRSCKDHDMLLTIELCLKECDASISFTRNDAVEKVRVAFGRDAFDLLYYLAEERAANELDWISKVESDQKGIPYRFTKEELWGGIRTKWHTSSSDGGSAKNINIDIARSAHEINKGVRNVLQFDSKFLIVPGLGRKGRHDDAGSYFLNPFIPSNQVTFHGSRFHQSLVNAIGR